MAHAVLVQQYPNSQFCTFRFENCARDSYQGTQYLLTNTSSGWSSGWQNTPPVSINNGISSNFNISMTPGFSYSVRTRMMWNGVWYDGAYPYEPISFYFTPPAPRPPTDRISYDHWSSTTSSITLRVLNTYGATKVDWKAVNQYTNQYHYFSNRETSGTPYYETLSGLNAGTQYTIGASGYNDGGYAGERTAAFSTRPAIPSINNGASEKNKITINVNPDGGFDLIEVEMWTIDAVSRIEAQSRGWNGGSQFSVTFGSNSPLTPNASYLFRARATKNSYSSTPTVWGGWLTVKNDMAKPTNWSWHTSKASGQPFNITAAEWNQFTTKINDFREYKSLTRYAFSNAVRGQPFYFYMFNEARAAINEMRATGLGTVTRGNPIYASHLNTLMNTLNAIT